MFCAQKSAESHAMLCGGENIKKFDDFNVPTVKTLYCGEQESKKKMSNTLLVRSGSDFEYFFSHFDFRCSEN